MACDTCQKGAHMDREAVQMASVGLIANAGDAFSHFRAAIDRAREGALEEAEAELAAGRQGIAEAHKAQIDLLACEARGEGLELTLLLVHAQDHLMNAMTFESVAREFVELYRERRVEASS